MPPKKAPCKRGYRDLTCSSAPVKCGDSGSTTVEDDPWAELGIDVAMRAELWAIKACERVRVGERVANE